MSKSNFEKFRNLINEVNQIKKPLYRLGVILLDNGCVAYNWQDDESIMASVNKLGWPEELTFEEKISLSLALTQEHGNSFIDQSEIDLVNKFFGINITFEMVQSMNNDFI